MILTIDPQLIRSALAEDIGSGDATTLATVPPELRATAWMMARHPIVVSGLPVATAVFGQVDSNLQVQIHVQDGQKVEAGTKLMTIEGSARGILTAERVVLNFVQRMSGVATLTAQFVAAVAGTGVEILDTRKTTPGLRMLEKYAMKCGGGVNHRIGLFDRILIKDNHLAALRDAKPNAIAAAIGRAREHYPQLLVEIEADTLEQASQAAEAGADIILLDNMSNDLLRSAVKLIGNRAKTEASGGVNLKNIRAIAETGVNSISVGAITHSAPAVDIGLDFPS